MSRHFLSVFFSSIFFYTGLPAAINGYQPFEIAHEFVHDDLSFFSSIDNQNKLTLKLSYKSEGRQSSNPTTWKDLAQKARETGSSLYFSCFIDASTAQFCTPTKIFTRTDATFTPPADLAPVFQLIGNYELFWQKNESYLLEHQPMYAPPYEHYSYPYPYQQYPIYYPQQWCEPQPASTYPHQSPSELILNPQPDLQPLNEAQQAEPKIIAPVEEPTQTINLQATPEESIPTPESPSTIDAAIPKETELFCELPTPQSITPENEEPLLSPLIEPLRKEKAKATETTKKRNRDKKQQRVFEEKIAKTTRNIIVSAVKEATLQLRDEYEQEPIRIKLMQLIEDNEYYEAEKMSKTLDLSFEKSQWVYTLFLTRLFINKPTYASKSFEGKIQGTIDFLKTFINNTASHITPEMKECGYFLLAIQEKDTEKQKSFSDHINPTSPLNGAVLCTNFVANTLSSVETHDTHCTSPDTCYHLKLHHFLEENQHFLTKLPLFYFLQSDAYCAPCSFARKKIGAIRQEKANQIKTDAILNKIDLEEQEYIAKRLTNLETVSHDKQSLAGVIDILRIHEKTRNKPFVFLSADHPVSFLTEDQACNNIEILDAAFDNMQQSTDIEPIQSLLYCIQHDLSPDQISDTVKEYSDTVWAHWLLLQAREKFTEEEFALLETEYHEHYRYCTTVQSFFQIHMPMVVEQPDSAAQQLYISQLLAEHYVPLALSYKKLFIGELSHYWFTKPFTPILDALIELAKNESDKQVKVILATVIGRVKKYYTEMLPWKEAFLTLQMLQCRIEQEIKVRKEEPAFLLSEENRINSTFIEAVTKLIPLFINNADPTIPVPALVMQKGIRVIFEKSFENATPYEILALARAQAPCLNTELFLVAFSLAEIGKRPLNPVFQNRLLTILQAQVNPILGLLKTEENLLCLGLPEKKPVSLQQYENACKALGLSLKEYPYPKQRLKKK